MRVPAPTAYVYASSDAVHHSKDTPSGSVDEIDNDRINGWCVDPLASARPVDLELRVADRLLAEFTTNTARADIARCYGIKTLCGFSFDLADIPLRLAGEALLRYGEDWARTPRDRGDLRVTVKGRPLELLRWHRAGLSFFNANLLFLLRSLHSPEPIGWFDADWYAAENPIVLSLGVEPLAHYRERGCKDGLPPNRMIAAAFGRIGIKPFNSFAGPQARMAEMIAGSGLFERAWYRERYGVPEEAAIAHYVSTGAFRGHDPSPFFSSFDYMRENLDSAKGGFNPLGHLILRGIAEGRSASASAMRLTAKDWLKGL